jgi:hypothetical protein
MAAGPPFHADGVVPPFWIDGGISARGKNAANMGGQWRRPERTLPQNSGKEYAVIMAGKFIPDRSPEHPLFSLSRRGFHPKANPVAFFYKDITF